ncbi:hypothetical protein LTR17_009721 [Elasticomyces elasticus]|nr:hypothetical protein LTR17_009721 [Elasticomyces elasticus]
MADQNHNTSSTNTVTTELDQTLEAEEYNYIEAVEPIPLQCVYPEGPRPTTSQSSAVGGSVAKVPRVSPSVPNTKHKASEMAREGKDTVNSGGGGRYSSQVKFWDESELKKVRAELCEQYWSACRASRVGASQPRT